jgi:hypothetical protein
MAEYGMVGALAKRIQDCPQWRSSLPIGTPLRRGKWDENHHFLAGNIGNRDRPE